MFSNKQIIWDKNIKMEQATFVEKKSDETRARIFQVALTYIKDHGVDKLTMRKLAEAADVSPALIIQYFGSKGNLLREAYNRHNALLREKLECLSVTANEDTLFEFFMKLADVFLSRDLESPCLTIEVLVHSLNELQHNLDGYQTETMPLVMTLTNLVMKCEPRLSEKKARMAGSTLALCYGNAIRYIIMLGLNREQALDYLRPHLNLIALGTEAMLD